MRLKLRTRTLLCFGFLIAAYAVASAVLSAVLVSRTTLEEAQRGVQANLRSAWGAFQARRQAFELLLTTLARSQAVLDACEGGDSLPCRLQLEAARRQAGLDFFTVTDSSGQVLVRSLEPHNTGDDLSNDPLISRALRGQTISGFQLLSAERLRRAGGDLEERAFMVFEPTPKAKPRARTFETSGMVLMAAAPVYDRRGELLGTLHCGVLLNRNSALVDHLQSILYGDARYRGRPLGTVTIFQWDVRIATTVVGNDGNRAIATRVSTAVYDNVLENARSWYDRAFVVNDWYVAAYDPIRDIDGRTIGMLYVGVLAEKYDDIRNRLWRIYVGFSFLAAAVAIGMAYLFARELTASLARLAQGAGRLAAGDLDITVCEPRRNDEVRDLTRDFNAMAAKLRARDRQLKNALAKLERANTELERVNSNYLDMLGFVSHELKNTLGVIYTAAEALANGLVGPMSPPQQHMVASIRRSIESAVTMTRNYLDLSRIEKAELQVQKQPMDLRRDVIETVLAELGQSLAAADMHVQTDLPQSIPLWGDANLLRVVYRNLMDNALKYGRAGGAIRLGCEPQDHTYLLEVWNEGQGATPEQLERLFEKFVRFGDDVGPAQKSTGLGLFIVQEIIRQHGGRIWAESEPGQFMRFLFTLPADPPAAQER